MKKVAIGFSAAAAMLLASLSPSGALALAGAGATSLTWNTSPRAEGVGGAGIGLAWDANTNHWANPALLAFRPGIQYLDFRSDLLKTLHDDLYVTSKELTVGAYGVTFLLGGGPVDGTLMSGPELEITDENGASRGTFTPTMQSEHFGLGVDFFQLAEIILGREPGHWTRNWTLTGGYVWKDFEEYLFPVFPISDLEDSKGTGQASDWGLMLRATPFRLGGENGLGDGGTMGLDLGFALGYSVLNSTDQFIRRPNFDQSDPFPTMHVYGGSLRLAAPLLETKREEWNAKGLGILGDMVNPLFSMTLVIQNIQPGFVWDAAAQDYNYEWDTSGTFDETGYGVEIGLANVVYFRLGHKKMSYGHVDGSSEGFGVNLQAGGFGGFRYDWASIPRAEGLADDTSRTWSVWVDPVAVFQKK